MMQLNRAKFMVNGGIGYVLKPPPMCKGNEQTAQVKSQTRVHSTSSAERNSSNTFLFCLWTGFTVVLNQKGKLKTNKQTKKR